MNEAKLTKQEFIKELQAIADQCHNADEFNEKLKIAFPCVAAIITYHSSGRMYMGTALSFHHKGSILF